MSVVLSLLMETYLEVLLGGDEVLPKHVLLQRSPFQSRILRLNLLCGEDLVRNGKWENGKWENGKWDMGNPFCALVVTK